MPCLRASQQRQQLCPLPRCYAPANTKNFVSQSIFTMTSTVLVLLCALGIVASSIIERKEPTNYTADEMLMFMQASQPLRRNIHRRRLLSSMLRIPSGGGMTRDFCQTSADCKGSRDCVDSDYVHGGDICTGEAECHCNPPRPRPCYRTAHCEAGEVCPKGRLSNLCYSESYADDADERPLSIGLTMDYCSESRYCEEPRTCQVLINGVLKSCAGRSGCRCVPPQLQACTAHRQCPFGELCATKSTSGSRKATCYSEKYASNSSELVPLPRKLTLDPCVTGKDCQTPRTCWAINSNNEPKLCLSRPACYCAPEVYKRCRTSQSCVDGEVCVRDTTATVRRSDNPYCVSRAYANQNKDVAVVDSSGTSVQTSTPGNGQTAPPANGQTPTPAAKPGLGDSGTSLGQQASDDAICIDAKALGRFDKEELLFKTHQQAKVLCDKHASCATPGHIVMFRGKGMMMKSYCKLTSCKERIMMVNSPKYRRSFFVSSMTTGLQYTSLAARYETRGEELLLAALIRVGL